MGGIVGNDRHLFPFQILQGQVGGCAAPGKDPSRYRHQGFGKEGELFPVWGSDHSAKQVYLLLFELLHGLIPVFQVGNGDGDAEFLFQDANDICGRTLVGAVFVKVLDRLEVGIRGKGDDRMGFEPLALGCSEFHAGDSGIGSRGRKGKSEQKQQWEQNERRPDKSAAYHNTPFSRYDGFLQS